MEKRFTAKDLNKLRLEKNAKEIANYIKELDKIILNNAEAGHNIAHIRLVISRWDVCRLTAEYEDRGFTFKATQINFNNTNEKMFNIDIKW